MKKRILQISVIFIFCAGNISAQKISEKTPNQKGTFVSITGSGGKAYRAYTAWDSGREGGYFISARLLWDHPAVKESVERLGALGYQTLAVDL